MEVSIMTFCDSNGGKRKSLPVTLPYVDKVGASHTRRKLSNDIAAHLNCRVLVAHVEALSR